MQNIDNIKPKRKQKSLLKREEIQKVLKQMNTSTFHEYRLWTQTRLILDTGIRAGECCSIKPEELDFKHNSILVTNPKSNKER